MLRLIVSAKASMCIDRAASEVRIITNFSLWNLYHLNLKLKYRELSEVPNDANCVMFAISDIICLACVGRVTLFM